MVGIRPGADSERVVAQLNAQSRGQFKAWTRAELGEANQAAMFKERFIVIMLGFSLFLGILIGVAITWQTLRGAIMANIKEFASLRALGVSMGSLRAIVMELSFWVGIAGIFAAGLLTWAVSLLATTGGLTMAFPIPMVAGVCIMLLVIALASGFLSLGVLKKSQPADLLR
jgi:putative ABC transport system permease protein